jgi:hypothetical protein
MKPTHRYDTKAYHDYYIHQAGKGYPVFAGRRYQRGLGFGSIFGGLFIKSSHAFVEKGSKDPRTRGFKNGIQYCRRCRTRKKYQTGSKITIEINRRKLTPESYGHGRTPGQRVIKGPAKRKKTRRQQTKQRNTSNDNSDKNGTCTSQLMRMHEIKTGCI